MNAYSVKQPDIQGQFELLLQIEPTGVNFLTCSLDIEGGRYKSLKNLRQIQPDVYQNLTDRQQQVDFEHAIRMVEIYLENLNYKAKSILIFSRGITGGQFFLATPVSVLTGNHMIFQSTPALKKLHEIVKREIHSDNGQYMGINLHWEEDGGNHFPKGVLPTKHLESDDSSYGLTLEVPQWQNGEPVILRTKLSQFTERSLDQVA